MRFTTVALAVETVLIAGIILYVPYTEIDWRAYMEEVSGFLDGQLDYRQLKGGTGPLVYPGGFVWIYSALYYFTKNGEDIQLAQWIFAGVYLFTLVLVLRLYTRAGLTWKVIIPLFISKRIRSLYVLRLFNDCWAMLCLFIAMTAIAGAPLGRGRRSRNWLLGCFFFSLAVSIKMNVLLFAPGMLYVMLRTLPLWKVLGLLFTCALWQVLAGLPFLAYDYEAYLAKGFELSRVFTQRWSVNYQFLDNEIFVSPKFGLALLAMTLASWVLLWRIRWAKRTYLTSAEAETVRTVIRDVPRSAASAVARTKTMTEEEYDDALDAQEAAEEQAAFVATVLTFFESNLIGVIFARSLHYQFYTWFFFSVPFVLAYTAYPRILRLATFALIRQGFERYPPTPQSSVLLQTGFALALVAVLFLGCDSGDAGTKEQTEQEPKQVKQIDGTAGEAKDATTTTSAGAASSSSVAADAEVDAPAMTSPRAAVRANKSTAKPLSPSPKAASQSPRQHVPKASPKPAAKPAAKHSATAPQKKKGK